ncbi:NnrS family protein [Novosphingobium album (ex Liu et al. 2023)]|uniref:NnrS family protein n=1 Tax=Novosphingobium album (ex Liu et al. 2023) TaxID=3031130 RepID=A0ABT5WWD5_9SPHN|nr:NnrS family protein [Novosphingobium album (ex Liu et al. 2023)]MDE8654213.1 NnrS family protein [Novosphingobium album (ex Liu et al. 2023)]
MSSLSATNLGRAPHRLMFFVGGLNLLLAMAWWACWLASARWNLFVMPQPEPYAGRLHAFLMQYQVLPSFFFGFLLTVFPRWIGEPDLDRRKAWPVAAGLLGGQILTLVGAIGWSPGLILGTAAALAGWILGLLPLARLVWHDAGKTWHAAGCFAALCLGAIGLLLWLGYLLTGDEALANVVARIGTFGLLAPVYFTVAHRMIPFFSASALPGYEPWRPLWVLALGWALLVLRLGLPADGLWLSDLPLFLLSLLVFFRWVPRRRMPPLLLVLYGGLAWLPIALALFTVQDIAFALDGAAILGKAPAHALFIGFFGSILVAMVTRVTQGHSGRPLLLPPVAGYAFAAIQLVCVARIWAELADDWLGWQAAAAIGWLIAFLPWVLWAAWIYATPRIDGQPG